jgi:hypothetical protein
VIEYSVAVQAALWSVNCFTLSEAQELTGESPCLQRIPAHARLTILGLLTIAGTEGTLSYWWRNSV